MFEITEEDGMFGRYTNLGGEADAMQTAINTALLQSLDAGLFALPPPPASSDIHPLLSWTNEDETSLLSLSNQPPITANSNFSLLNNKTIPTTTTINDNIIQNPDLQLMLAGLETTPCLFNTDDFDLAFELAKSPPQPPPQVKEQQQQEHKIDKRMFFSLF